MTKGIYLRCNIYNILVNAAKFSAEQDVGGFGTVIASDLAARLLEKIARRAWEIDDEEIKCYCYRLGLVEKTDALEKWFEETLNKMNKNKTKIFLMRRARFLKLDTQSNVYMMACLSRLTFLLRSIAQ